MSDMPATPDSTMIQMEDFFQATSLGIFQGQVSCNPDQLTLLGPPFSPGPISEAHFTARKRLVLDAIEGLGMMAHMANDFEAAQGFADILRAEAVGLHIERLHLDPIRLGQSVVGLTYLYKLSPPGQMVAACHDRMPSANIPN